MATSFSTKERETTRQTGASRPTPPNVERQIAGFLLGVTLTVSAFLLYGAHNDTAKIMRASKPIHILHHDYLLSGKQSIIR